jgi:uncharacterized protein
VKIWAHTSHPDIIKRLKRAHGHLASVIIMFEQESRCLEIAQQLQTIESAVANAKKIRVPNCAFSRTMNAGQGP